MILHHQMFGSGPPLLLAHGLFGSSRNWRSISLKLGARHSVFALDLRNHGDSPWSPVLDYPSMAADIREFMGDHGIARASILGHSMGGKTAMQLALDFPDTVDRCVAVDIAPRQYPPGHDEILDALAAVDPSLATTRSEVDQALTRGIPNTAVRQFLLTNLVRKKGGGFRWKMNLQAIRQNYASLLEGPPADKHFDRPALFVVGGRSNFVEDSDIPAARRIFPHAEFKTIPSATHWVHADAPEELVQIVLEFLTPGG